MESASFNTWVKVTKKLLGPKCLLLTPVKGVDKKVRIVATFESEALGKQRYSWSLGGTVSELTSADLSQLMSQLKETKDSHE